MSDDFGHVHLIEYVMLKFVCGGAIFFVAVEIWYFFCIVSRIPMGISQKMTDELQYIVLYTIIPNEVIILVLTDLSIDPVVRIFNESIVWWLYVR